MKSTVRRRPSAYTLIEILVALGILSLAIGAASQLSLGQSVTEELNQRETMAVNYGENLARLWQLGLDNPDALLLRTPNADGTLMTASAIPAPANLHTGPDYSSTSIQVHSSTVTVFWKPLQKKLSDQTQVNATTPLTFPVLRLKPEVR